MSLYAASLSSASRYILNIEVSYKLNDEEITQKEKGLVVFIKDMEKGNYFTWKLVKFDRYRIAD